MISKKEINKIKCPKCPKCGQSYYQKLYITSTCMYFTPIYKDGICISNDKNISTIMARCLNCHTDFTFQTVGGELYEEYKGN